MTTPSSFLADLSSVLDGIEAALISQNTDSLQALCLQLQQGLQQQARAGLDPETWGAEQQALAQSVEKRLAVVRQTLLQQGAAAERALATLLPDRAVGSYGDKSGFGHAARGTNLKSYQA